MSTRIIVTVEGGLVQSVYCSDPDAVVDVADFDCEEYADPRARDEQGDCALLRNEARGLTEVW